MLKKFTIYSLLLSFIVIGTGAIKSNPNADTGRTGATGVTCVDGCHSSFALNTAGGSVTVSGLPVSYGKSIAYPFTLTINHSAANRTKWGFAIKAVNPSGGAAVGTFSTTNTTNIRIANNEATSKTAPTTAASNTYTFTGLTWTSPAAPPAAVKFYFVGNAANNDNTRLNDYIYSGTLDATILPLKLSQFTAAKNLDKVVLTWSIENNIDNKYCIVERSNNKTNFETIATINGSNTDGAKQYSFADALQNSNVYYRLQMVDKEGNKTYSQIISLNSKASDRDVLNVYPNPAKKGQIINVEVMSDKDQIANITLVDIKGRIVSSKVKNISKGFNKLDVNFGNLILVGNYYLSVKMDNSLSTPINISITE